ncbi:MAG TPA: DUF4349 domain-containing protein [Polyangiaceae bacterium]
MGERARFQAIMRPRFPGFGFVLRAALASAPLSCGAGAVASGAPGVAETAATAPGLPAPPAPEPSPTAADAPSALVTRQAAPEGAAPQRELLDIEAHVALQVANVPGAASALRKLAARMGGVVTEEKVDSSSEQASADFTLRVPSTASEGALAELEKLGRVLSQTVTARDISKQYFDANLRLSSLEATLNRYLQILGKADKVDEILRVEQEIARLRAEIEQVKGNLRWLSDRAARATLHVSLRERQPEVVAARARPEPMFYPGARASLLFDFAQQTQSYAGGGVSVRLNRALSLDLDVLGRFDAGDPKPDAFLASVGGELHSELLGGSERTWLSPYLGWRAGYARLGSDDQAMLGATLGVTVYKSRWLVLDLDTRHYLIFGGERGAHYGLTPAVAAAIAF